MKWLPLAVVKHVRRYKHLCSDVCRRYRSTVRYVCVANCIRIVKRCDPTVGPAYAACVEEARRQVVALVERIRDRVTY